jgi:hypothetical protein
MTFNLSDDEENGVMIAINTILKRAFKIGESEDWSYLHDEWWDRHEPKLGGNSARRALPIDPTRVINLALDTYEKGSL